MNRGSFKYLTLYFLLGFLLVLAPSTNLYAQDEDDSVEEIFWGDEEEDEGLDEEFDFSDDEEFEDDMEGLEFEDDEFMDDEFDDEFIDDEDTEDFSEDFADEPEEDIVEAANRLGYTLNLVGASPGFVNRGLNTYDTGVDFRASVELPMLLQIAGIRFRLGAEVGTFKFSNNKPGKLFGGVYSGIHATGILSFPAGPGQVRLGGGIVGSGLGIIAENSYGFTLGNALDVRIGVRSTTSFDAVDDKKNKLGNVSWLDGILVLGVNL